MYQCFLTSDMALLKNVIPRVRVIIIYFHKHLKKYNDSSTPRLLPA